MALELTYYVAMDIGCIECGESSRLLGVFTDRERAEAVCDATEKLQRENWQGQHSMEIFETTAIDEEVPVVYG